MSEFEVPNEEFPVPVEKTLMQRLVIDVEFKID